MGIFLDTVEDNAERGWDVEIRRYLIRSQQNTKNKLEPLEICPRCFKRFFIKQDLQDHIFYEHRSDEILIQVGGIARSVRRDSIRIEAHLIRREQEVFLQNQNLIAQNQAINLDLLNALIHAPDTEVSIQQYRRGIFGYLDALHFERNSQLGNKDNAIRRFESVYGYLQPFSDSLAQQIRMSIALRFNWFKTLGYAPMDSIFYLAYIFFSNPYTIIENISLPIETKQRQAEGVYISERSEKLLKLIEIFFNERINKAEVGQILRTQILKTMHSTPDCNQPHNEDLHLVSARIYRKLDNTVEACSQYRKLVHSKQFSSEAKEYVYGTSISS